MSAHIPPNGVTPAGGNILIYYATAPIGTVSLGCYTVAFEITPSTEEIDVGVMCNASLTDQGRTTYSAVLTMLWEPALYTLLEPHINHQGEFKYFTEPPDATRHITFNTKFVAQPWGRFEVGQRVEVELPLAVLSTPIWADTV